ncbi:CutA1 divalent ion tolerance protein [Fulvimarina pelagi HTCC2506]|uniref:CutA1 divalent ion tolerance protein n=1 Tax=Fulvimarina pelagi HTCC2506 TaxID=314231 RepID=Q0G7P1_9HYPH|nr:divalent-cation tolerance protein CutA [Fulvimarina pelagi]EAU42323.1 CutA1 divalent ion tolerance protein [Fulvimarina pelagi HTCC2506]
MTDIIEIQTTCPTLEDARQLAHILLDEKLSACCQIGREIDSRYWYDDKQHRGDETPLIVKTRADLFDRIAKLIREHHPYETPAIFGFAVPFVDQATRDWIDETCTGG